MTESGHELRDNNEKIVKLMSILKKQRDEMNFLIKKQEEEKSRIQNEIEKLSFKLTLLTKSLGQRTCARCNYDKTIKEIDDRYKGLVMESGRLLCNINKEVQVLEEIMDKKTDTGGTASKVGSPKEPPPNPESGEEVKSKLSQEEWASNKTKSSSSKISEEKEVGVVKTNSPTMLKRVEVKSLTETAMSKEQDLTVTSYSDVEEEEKKTISEGSEPEAPTDEVQSYGEAYGKQHSEQSNNFRRPNAK